MSKPLAPSQGTRPTTVSRPLVRQGEPRGFQGALVQIVAALRVGSRTGRAPAPHDLRRFEFFAMVVGFLDPFLEHAAQPIQDCPMLRMMSGTSSPLTIGASNRKT